jgi:hypothetical protein
MKLSRVGFRPPSALVEAVAARMGMSLDFARVVMFVHEWARLEAQRGERIGIETFVAESVDSRRTCYARLERFRDVFGAELGERCTPGDLIVWPHGVPERVGVAELGWRAVPA